VANESYDPVGVALVPGLVLVGVVEQQGSSLFPVPDLSADPDPRRCGRFRDHERQVMAQHSAVGAVMRGQSFARTEDREEGCGQTWDRP